MKGRPRPTVRVMGNGGKISTSKKNGKKGK